MGILDISAPSGNKAVQEISRSRSFFGTSHLHLRLNCEPQTAWSKVRSLFAQIQFQDESAGVIRGRIKGSKRGTFSRRVNQWVTLRFDERNADYSLAVFEISIFLIGRGADGFVFDQIIDMLHEYGEKPRSSRTWFTRLTADTKTPFEAISTGGGIALSCTTLALVFFDYMLVGAWAKGVRRDPFLSAITGGFVLGLTYFIIPVGLVVAIGFGVYTLVKRKHIAVAITTLLISGIALFLWPGFW